MKLSKIHHIAIIGTDYNKTTGFYINKLKFEKISEYNRPEKNDILLNVKKGDIVLEIFIKKRKTEMAITPLISTQKPEISKVLYTMMGKV